MLLGPSTVEELAALANSQYEQVVPPRTIVKATRTLPKTPLLVRELTPFEEDSECYGVAFCGQQLYLSQYTRHVVDVIHTERGSRLAGWGEFGKASITAPPGHSPRFDKPWGLAIDPHQRRVYVTGEQNHRVVVIDLDEGIVEAVWGSRGESAHNFFYPRGIALAPHTELLYVVDGDNNCVKALRTEDGECVRVLGSGLGRGKTQMSNPHGVCVDRQYVYVTDTNNHRVVVYSQHEGRFVRRLGAGHGEGEAQFNTPIGVSVDEKSGLLYVADSNNHRVSVWSTSDGTFQRQWTITLNHEKKHPIGVEWDPASSVLYVTLLNSKSVLVYNVG
eukprot:TRINITY_DN13109_c0_g1_i1.p1 TRINITY_DN13109_c0_g1~~TRINITY_DN13109_c0_g1_i1.p1  ORF type:complete len:332 (-),score=63.57 TRINITY_DN13109_c0_g1_i1:124-1119(-)